MFWQGFQDLAPKRHGKILHWRVMCNICSLVEELNNLESLWSSTGSCLYTPYSMDGVKILDKENLYQAKN